MGREAQCEVQLGERHAQAKVLLETDAIIIRGELRTTVPFAEIRKLAADERALTFRWKKLDVALALGAQSRAWAEKIERPPSLLDKLGVKPEHAVVVLGAFDEPFLSELAARCATVSRRARACDLAIVRVETKQLSDLVALYARLEPKAGLWLVRTRGDTELSESRIRQTCRAAGLVDVKTARFSETLTADKFTRRKG